MEKKFGNLSEFIGRDVELFRSSDLNNTAIYFTEVEDKNRENASAYFELLRFGMDGGDQMLYVREPGTDFFVEMDGGGFGSSHGDMMEASGRNAFLEPYYAPFKVYSHGDNLIYVMGVGGFPKFNFMKRVAEYNRGNKYDNYERGNIAINTSEIEAALKLKYLKLPEDIRGISYCMKTKEVSPKYFVVDYPAYNFNYTNQRFRMIENDIVKEYKVTKFTRYRDGGTTFITVLDENNIEHKFISPQHMFPREKFGVVKIGGIEYPNPIWDGIELEDATDAEKENLISLLKIELEPVEAED